MTTQLVATVSPEAAPLAMRQCEDCDWSGPLEALDPIDNIHERVLVGEIMAAGQCPECGSLFGAEDNDIPSYTLDSCVREFVRRSTEVLSGDGDTAGEVAMFGTTRLQLDAVFSAKAQRAAGCDAPMLCLSHLSDLQERLAMLGRADATGLQAGLEDARQALNRVKYALATFCVGSGAKMK